MATLGMELDLFRRELLKGSSETIILCLLATESMYGYQLVREMDQRSGGYFRLKEGTLYPVLHRLERDGLVVGRWNDSATGQNRRYYFITPLGHRRLESMLEEWDQFKRAVNQIAQPVSTLVEAVFRN